MADELLHKLKKYKAYLEAHPHGDKVFQVLRKLTSLPMTVTLLQETGLGKAVNGFRKREGEVGQFACQLIAGWKVLVRESVKRKSPSGDEENDDDDDARSGAEEEEEAPRSGDEASEGHGEGGRGDNSEGSEAAGDGEEEGSDVERSERGEGEEEAASYHSRRESSDEERDGSDRPRSASEDERSDDDADDGRHRSSSRSPASASDEGSGRHADDDSCGSPQASRSYERSGRDHPHSSGSKKDHGHKASSSGHDGGGDHHRQSATQQTSSSREKDVRREGGRSKDTPKASSRHNAAASSPGDSSHREHQHKGHRDRGSGSHKHSGDQRLQKERAGSSRAGGRSSGEERHLSGQHHRSGDDKHTRTSSGQRHPASSGHTGRTAEAKRSGHSADASPRPGKSSSQGTTSAPCRSVSQSKERAPDRQGSPPRLDQRGRGKSDGHSSHGHQPSEGKGRSGSGQVSHKGGAGLHRSSSENRSSSHHRSRDQPEERSPSPEVTRPVRKDSSEDSEDEEEEGTKDVRHSKHSSSHQHSGQRSSSHSSSSRHHSSSHSDKSFSSRHRGSEHSDKSSGSRHQGSEHSDKSFSSRHQGSEHSDKSSGSRQQGSEHSDKSSGSRHQGSDHRDKSSSSRHQGSNHGDGSSHELKDPKTKSGAHSVKPSSHKSSEHTTSSRHSSSADKTRGDRGSHKHRPSAHDKHGSAKPTGVVENDRGDSERTLFDSLAEVVPRESRSPEEDDSCEDYADYIDSRVGGGATEYQPGAVKKRERSGSRSVDDYEELIDRQVGDDCAEYRPGRKPKDRGYTRLKTASGKKEYSQSPDDYGDYIDRDLKADCAEYRPGSKKPGRRSKSSKEASPVDYGEWIDQRVKDTGLEYQPGGQPSRPRAKERKDVSRSPDDYEEYIEQGVKRDCAQYKPSFIKKEKQYEVCEEGSDEGGDADARQKHASRRHAHSSSSGDSTKDSGKERHGHKEKERPQKETDRQKDVHRKTSREREKEKAKTARRVTDSGGSEVLKAGSLGRERHRPGPHPSLKHHKITDMDIILRPDGKLFQEPKDARGSDSGSRSRKQPPTQSLSPSPARSTTPSPVPAQDPYSPSPAHDDSPQHGSEDPFTKTPPRTNAQEETRPGTLPSHPQSSHKHASSGSRSQKPNAAKKSSKQPVDAKALIQDSLFAAPDDHSVKVPGKKRQPLQDESADRRNPPLGHSASKLPRLDKPPHDDAERSGTSLKSSAERHAESDRLGKLGDRHSHRTEKRSSPVSHDPTETGHRTKSREKSSDKHPRSSDKHAKSSDKSLKPSSEQKSKSSKRGLSEEIPEGSDDNVTSFEDSLNYDEGKAIKKRRTERVVLGGASSLGRGLPFPTPPKQMKLTSSDILASLDEPSINYRPRHLLPVDEDRHRDHEEDERMIAPRNVKTRTQVYSGRRHGLTKVDSLATLSLQVLMKNIDAIEYMGPVPYYLIKPLLERCSAVQLYNLEDFNPHLLEDTDELWKVHCQKEFWESGCEPEEMETWRELYLRKSEEREAKYVKLRENMSKTMTKGQSGNKVRMAFMDTVAKPPREVRRQQLKHGTAGIVRGGKSSEPSTSSSYTGAQSFRHKAYLPMKSLGPPVEDRSNRAQGRPMAPMMQKTLKMMKKIRR